MEKRTASLWYTHHIMRVHHLVMTLLLLPTNSLNTAAAFLLTLLPSSLNNRATLTTTWHFALQNAKDHDDNESRMNMVRILQKSYYRNTADDETTTIGATHFGTQSHKVQFDESTGTIRNLPLWRVNWVETPGRSNCLNVHEGRYTHMFETILSSRREPLYFGHLYVPVDSSADAKTSGPEQCKQLTTWRDELADDAGRFDPSVLDTYQGNRYVNERPAVIGCLMQITDYRRMNDGRFMVLVQALERFVVEDVVETEPYGVANVRILLDEEELLWNNNDSYVSEDSCKYLRGELVSSSFHYHDYEFDKAKLPISKGCDDDDDGDGDACEEYYLSKDDVPWVGISKLLPFARYSTDDTSLMNANERRQSVERLCMSTRENASGELPLERRLQNGAILWNPPPLMSSDRVIRQSRDLNDCDALETLIWLAIDDFCRAASFALPEEVACLIPPEMDYLDLTIPSTTVALSPQYPKMRRQRRLSYLAPALIENLDVGKDMRQVWLNTPSTRARLVGVLERFDHLNNEIMGQFE